MNQTCSTCGGYIYLAAYGALRTRSCTCRPGPMVGWQCPACGGGNSPQSSRCPCKPLLAPVVTLRVQVGGAQVQDATTELIGALSTMRWLSE